MPKPKLTPEEVPPVETFNAELPPFETTTTAGTFEGVPQGDAPMFAEPVAPPASVSAPASPTAHVGEAVLIVGVAGFVIAQKTGEPLTTNERARLVEALGPVLGKYNVPSLVPPEEAELLSVVADVMLPRIMRRLPLDTFDTGEEGQREEHGAPARSVSGLRVGPINLSGVARPARPA